MKLFNSLKKIGAAILATVSTAVVAFAQVSGSVTVGFGDTAANNTFGQTVAGSNTIGGTLLNFMSLAQEMVSRAVPLLIGAAVVVFFASLVLFIWKSKDGKDASAGKSMMIWSVVALFVMVSIWGLVGFIGSVLGVGQGGGVPVPQIPTAN